MRRNRFSASSGNEATFFVEGEAYYQAYLQMIAEARHTIHLQTYIYEMDSFGLRVKEALVAAAIRGVNVYLLVDAVGSRVFDDSVFEDFRRAGVHFYRFNEIHGRKWIGDWARRLHHKILLADGKAMVGGINVVSLTFEVPGAVPHLDFAVCIAGEVTLELKTYCERIFTQATHGKIVILDSGPAVQAPVKDSLKLQISVNDWALWKNQIAKQYSRLVETAESDIVIINSYFFPRRRFMRQLVAARRRGVRVRLILPKYSDWTISVLASEYLYSYFLKRGVEVYQWRKSVLHGKMATVDNHTTTVGSFNLHYTAYQQNLEMNVDVFSDSFTQRLNATIETWLADSCEKASLHNIEGAPLKVRFLRLVSYAVMSLIANFSVAISTRGLKSNSY